MFLVREPMKFLTSRVAISHLGRESQNKTNSENRHLVFSMFKKKPQEKLHRLRRFLVFFSLNIENTRCLFSEFV